MNRQEKQKYRTEQTGQNRQDSADRTAQTGENRQVRTTRARKTGSGKLNHTIGTLLCRQQRVSPCKIQILYSIAYQKFNTILPLMSPKDTSDENFSKIFEK